MAQKLLNACEIIFMLVVYFALLCNCLHLCNIFCMFNLFNSFSWIEFFIAAYAEIVLNLPQALRQMFQHGGSC